MTNSIAATLRLPRKDGLPVILLGAAAALLVLVADWRLAASVMGLPVAFAGTWWILAAPHRWWITFAAVTLLLPPLPFDWGNTGPHFAVLIAGLGVWSGLLRFSEWRFPRLEIGLPATAVFFFAALLLSVPLALLYSGVAVAAGSLVRALLLGIAIYTLFAFAYGPSLHRTDSLALIKRLHYLGAAAVLIACVDFYLQFSPPAGFSAQYVWLPEGAMRRAQGFFYDAGMLGNLCAFFLVMLVLSVLRPAVRPQLMSRKVLLAGCALFSLGLLFSFSRSSLLNLSASLGVLAIVHRADLWPHRRRIAFTFAAMTLGVLLAALMFPAYAEVYGSRIWYTATRGFLDPEGLLSGRLQTWRALWDFLSAHPWYLFLGIGFKTLPYTSLVGRPLIADNMYLSILVETGIAGLLSMMLFSAAILHAGFRAMRSACATASFLGAWIFCFWIGQLAQMLFVDVLTYWRVLPLYFAVLGLAVRETARSQAATGGKP